MRPFWAIAGLSVLTAVGAAGQTAIRGVVQLQTDDRIEALANATVAVSAIEPYDRLGVTRTDRNGAFELTIDSTQRIALTASKRGYYNVETESSPQGRVVLDCANPSDCHDLRFRLRRASVIAGFVVDQFGDPIQEVEVTASRFPDPAGGEPLRAGRCGSDDLGRFRIADLRPGRYRLDTRSYWLYFDPGRSQLTGEPVEIEIAEGEQIEGLQLQLSTDPVTAVPQTFRVSGRVNGVDLSKPGVHFIHIRVLDPSRMWGTNYGRSLGEDGRFFFDRVPRGRYLFSYDHRSHAYEESNAKRLLAALDVNANLTELALSPAPPTGVRGAMHLEPPLELDEVRLSLSSDELGARHTTTAQAPAFEFAFESLLPSVYTISVGSWPREFFLEGVKRGDRLEATREFRILEGAVDEVELVLSASFATLRGVVRQPRRDASEPIQPASQFWVTLKGPGRPRATQTDQAGGFVLDKLAPGSYRIAAWPRASWQMMRDEQAWNDAGDAVRAFELEPGADVSIDLTAVP